MTTEVPTADGLNLSEELAAVIAKLEPYDARYSQEAAVLLQAALGTLSAPDAIRAYDSITRAIGRLARLATRHDLSEETAYFMGIVGDDYGETFAARDEGL